MRRPVVDEDDLDGLLRVRAHHRLANDVRHEPALVQAFVGIGQVAVRRDEADGFLCRGLWCRLCRGRAGLRREAAVDAGQTEHHSNFDDVRIPADLGAVFAPDRTVLIGAVGGPSDFAERIAFLDPVEFTGGLCIGAIGSDHDHRRQQSGCQCKNSHCPYPFVLADILKLRELVRPRLG